VLRRGVTEGTTTEARRFVILDGIVCALAVAMICA
jgi:hypothetical protein